MQYKDSVSTAVPCALETCESAFESESSQSSQATDEGYLSSTTTTGSESDNQDEDNESACDDGSDQASDETEEEEEEEEEDGVESPYQNFQKPAGSTVPLPTRVSRCKHLCAAFVVASRKEGGTPQRCRNLALNGKNYCWIPKHLAQWQDVGLPILRESEETRRARRSSSPIQPSDVDDHSVTDDDSVTLQLADVQQRLSDMEASWNHTFESFNRTVTRQREEQGQMRQQIALLEEILKRETRVTVAAHPTNTSEDLLIDLDGNQHHYQDCNDLISLETKDEDAGDDLGHILDYYSRPAPIARSGSGEQADTDFDSNLDSPSPLSDDDPLLTLLSPSERAEDGNERSLSKVQIRIQDPKMPQSSYRHNITQGSCLLSSSSSSTKSAPGSSCTNDELGSTQSQSQHTADMGSQREIDTAESTVQGRLRHLAAPETPSNAVTQQDLTSLPSHAPLPPAMSSQSITGASHSICTASDPQPGGRVSNGIEVAGVPTSATTTILPASSQQQQQPLNQGEKSPSSCCPLDLAPQTVHERTRSQEQARPEEVSNVPVDTLTAEEREREKREIAVRAVEQADSILGSFGIKPFLPHRSYSDDVLK